MTDLTDIQSADAICAAMRKRFPAPEYECCFEVANATGFNGDGYCDAIVMSTWPSRGLLLHGYEIKVSRTDWLREVKNPKKAERFARYCDRWSLIVSKRDIIAPMELPPTWGLGYLYGDSIRFEIDPKPLEPIPIDRGFLASLMRAAGNNHGLEKRLQDMLSKEREKISEEIERRVKQSVEHRTGKLTKLEKRVQEFKVASGIDIDNWNAGDIGAAVRLVLDHGEEYFFNQARSLHQKLGELLAEREEKTTQ